MHFAIISIVKILYWPSQKFLWKILTYGICANNVLTRFAKADKLILGIARPDIIFWVSACNNHKTIVFIMIDIGQDVQPNPSDHGPPLVALLRLGLERLCKETWVGERVSNRFPSPVGSVRFHIRGYLITLVKWFIDTCLDYVSVIDFPLGKLE